MKSSILLLALMMFAFTACKNGTTTQNNTSDPVDETPASTCMGPKVGEAPQSDVIMSAEASIQDDCLVIRVTYSGGCQNHEFDLYWGEMWAESVPPQTQLFLHHENNDDNCRAIKSEEIKFDLKTIRYDGLEEAILHLNWGGEEGRISLNYKY